MPNSSTFTNAFVESALYYLWSNPGSRIQFNRTGSLSFQARYYCATTNVESLSLTGQIISNLPGFSNEEYEQVLRQANKTKEKMGFFNYQEAVNKKDEIENCLINYNFEELFMNCFPNALVPHFLVDKETTLQNIATKQLVVNCFQAMKEKNELEASLLLSKNSILLKI